MFVGEKNIAGDELEKMETREGAFPETELALERFSLHDFYDI
jgi:hypothetical protein